MRRPGLVGHRVCATGRPSTSRRLVPLSTGLSNLFARRKANFPSNCKKTPSPGWYWPGHTLTTLHRAWDRRFEAVKPPRPRPRVFATTEIWPVHTSIYARESGSNSVTPVSLGGPTQPNRNRLRDALQALKEALRLGSQRQMAARRRGGRTGHARAALGRR